MASDGHDSEGHQCKRCGTAIAVREDRWFRHDWSEEKSTEEVQKVLDEDRELEDWFSEGGMLCPSCHADFLVFLGVDDERTVETLPSAEFDDVHNLIVEIGDTLLGELHETDGKQATVTIEVEDG